MENSAEVAPYLSRLQTLEELPEVAFLKTCPTPHALLDGRRVLFMNPAAVSLLDGPSAEYFVGRDLMEWIHPLDQERFLYRMSALTEQQPQNEQTLLRLRTATGITRTALVNSAQISLDGRQINMASALDVSQILGMNAALRASEENFQRLFENMHDVFYRTNERQELVLVGPGVTRMLGYTVEEVLGKPAADYYVEPQERQQVLQAIRQQGEIRDYPARLRHKDGHTVHVAITSKPMLGAQGELLGVEGIFRDVTTEVEARAALTRLATHDDLTNTLNRRAFLEQVTKHVRHLRRYPEECLLAIVDLDHFKAVNDRHGHLAGDKVLKVLVEVIRDSLRSTDLFGRLGGDEFAVALRNCCPEEGFDILRRLLHQVRATSVALGKGERVPLSVSLGVTPLLGEDQPVALAMARADRALYLAKEQGRGCFAFAPPEGEPFLSGHPFPDGVIGP